MLGTPPAFVLSQDQTLVFNLCLLPFGSALSLFVGSFSRLAVYVYLRLLHYTVFKVRVAVSRDSFDSLPNLYSLVNTFFEESLIYYSSQLVFITPYPCFRPYSAIFSSLMPK